ncbi:hypothetical protein BofuT4_P138670.1 [Botrytis cinerea T4]|uniref:Uncharacterized protein n=1 Tax=Botryotinia fuckeliana (strain T4) TaxID=999810 RepID=G2YMU5_BOTF4|nr:hypothetical protein BofuT4_P138670.1 [Botrytis cinerea T4]
MLSRSPSCAPRSLFEGRTAEAILATRILTRRKTKIENEETGGRSTADHKTSLSPSLPTAWNQSLLKKTARICHCARNRKAPLGDSFAFAQNFGGWTWRPHHSVHHPVHPLLHTKLSPLVPVLSAQAPGMHPCLQAQISGDLASRPDADSNGQGKI